MSSAINRHLITLMTHSTIMHIGGFFPIQNEPDLLETYTSLTTSGCILYLPKATNRGDEPYHMAPWAPGQPLKPGLFGVPEPTSDPIPVTESDKRIDYWLIPGLAFSITGARIGFGGGYYDRLLANVTGIKIGIAYPFQLQDTLPTAEHDVEMDIVVTPSEIRHCTLQS